MHENHSGGRPPIIRAFLGDEVIADNFAGGGGASTGIELALGRSPDLAVNHDPEAIAMHAANHPTTEHRIESVWQVDPRIACRGKPVALAWFSPDCKHHSKAKGGKPREQKIRGLAWVAVTWAQRVRPRVIALENVEEFRDWGPLHRTGPNAGRPIAARRGQTFAAFVRKLERLGYAVEHRLLRACDYGAPTTRRRLFLIARCDGRPIVWPAPTHGPVATGRPERYRTAAEVIDWSIPCPSIFDRDRPLADKTMARIARGIRKFVLENPRPFLIPVNHGGIGRRDHRGRDIAEPMPTVTGGSCGGHAVVSPIVVKAKTHGGGGNDPMPADEPLRTVTASKRGEFAVVAPTLVRTAHGDVDASGKRRGKAEHSIEEPLPTVCASGTDFALVAPTIVRTSMHQSNAGCAYSAEDPLRTVTTDGGLAVAVPYLVHRSNGERPGQAPRIYDLDRPLGTIVAQGEKHALCAAFLAKHYGERGTGGWNGGSAANRPIDTVTARDHHSVVAANLVRYNGDHAGAERVSGVEDPLGTQDTSRRCGLVASHLVKLRGTSTAHVESCASSMDAPVPTISASGTHIAAVAAFLARYNGTSTGQMPDGPIGTLDTTDRYALVTVTIDGEDYVIVDIGMRMLTPRELFRAQGFSDEYHIDPEHNGKPLTKTAQIRMCGNSVCPPLAAAIVRAQFQADLQR